MIAVIGVKEAITLSDYELHGPLFRAVEELRAEARLLVPRLKGRRVHMVSSTAAGGGVAEMMPRLVQTLSELGLECQWLVMTPREPAFFALTKRLHNLIHGAGDPRLGPEERALYDRVSDACATALAAHVKPGDLVVAHDPQPVGTVARVRRAFDVRAIFRCHIGLDRETPETRAAWEFLKPDAEAHDHAVFSAPEYIREFLVGRSTVIYPSIDPLSHKNRELNPHKLVGILCNARLAIEHHPVDTPPFDAPALRLAEGGRFVPAADGGELGILYRPMVVQISRWDRLKGWLPLLEGFRRLKARLGTGHVYPERHRRRLEIVRLVLAGPDPHAVQDDPEGREVLGEVAAAWAKLPPRLREDVAVVALPMRSRKYNALMVNALQRSATVVVQNSLREGFGLTAAEAMWKGAAVLGTCAVGLRQQIRDGLDGRLVRNPEDPIEIANLLDEMLGSPKRRRDYGRTAERRVYDEFLVFRQARRWLELLVQVAAA